MTAPGFELGKVRKRNAARSELQIRDALRHKSTPAMTPEGLRPELSWPHYRLLLGVEETRA